MREACNAEFLNSCACETWGGGGGGTKDFWGKKSALFVAFFLFISASDKAIYFLIHHHNMQLFIVSNAITFISAFFNSFGLFGLLAIKITTKESEIYQIQPQTWPFEPTLLLKCAVLLTIGNGTINAMPVLSPECDSLLVTSFLYLPLFTPIKAATKIPYGVFVIFKYFWVIQPI